MDEVFEAVHKADLYSIVNFTFVPFGNAYFNTKKCYHPQYERQIGLSCWIRECEHPSASASDCFTAPLLCQHGTDECKENLIEACVLAHYADAKTHLPFLECYEGQRSIHHGNLAKCAEMNGIDADKVTQCASGSEGTDVTVANAKATVALGSAKLGTPWILINGESYQGSNLKRAICEAYTGTAPPGCHKGDLGTPLQNSTAVMC